MPELMKARSTRGPRQTALSEALPWVQPALAEALVCVLQQTAFTENYPVGQSASPGSCMQSMRKAEKKMCE